METKKQKNETLVIADYSLVVLLTQPEDASYTKHHQLSIRSTEYELITYKGRHFFQKLFVR